MSKVSKKTQGLEIFEQELAKRTAGEFASNKDFRNSVLTRMEAEIGVSRPSASTMYNQCKIAFEAADPSLGLGRDPKKEKVKTVKARTPKVKTETVSEPSVSTEVSVEA